MLEKTQINHDDKPYTGKDDLHDLETFYGRYQHFCKTNSCWNLFYSDNTLREYQESIKNAISTNKTGLSNKEQWHRHYVVKSNMHPETEEPILWPFRFSALTPLNVPIIAGISLLPPTPFNQAVSQTINQCYNFAINVNNASQSNPMTNNEIIFSQCACIGSAIGVSVGLRKMLQKIKSQNIFLKGCLMLTPYFAVAISNTVNQLCARYKDLQSGQLLIDPRTGEVMEGVKSVAAGYKGFKETLLKWWVLPGFAILGPPLITGAISKVAPVQSTNSKFRIISGMATCFLCISYGSTLGLSLFKPLGSIKLRDLEPNVREAFQGLDDETEINFFKGI